jgi:hypothetical protein
MKRRAGPAVFTMLSLLVAACGDSQPEAIEGRPGVGMSMIIQVEPTKAPCGTPPSKPILQDASGARWWSEGKNWCRSAYGALPAQAWVSTAGGTGTRRLAIDGQTIALLEPQVRLTPVGEAPPPAPFVPCGQDFRSRIFAAENRLREPRDLTCGRTFEGPAFKLTTAGFSGPGGVMPALVTTPAGKSAGTIVYLFGGPYENLPAGLVTRATTNHLLARWGRRAAIVIPSYVGIDRIRTGAGGATIARAEIDALIAKLQGQGPVCVIGFSLGGPIAATSVAQQPRTGFFLAAPLATTPASFVARAIAQGRPLRPLALASGEQGSKVLTLLSDKAYLDYFAGSENLDIAALVGPGHHPNLRIVYAAGDIPVLRGDLATVAPMLKPDAIRELPAAVGHSIETPVASSIYQPLMDGFLADCLHQNP